MDLENHLSGLARRANLAVPPHVDVVERVCRTIRVQEEEPALFDMPSLAFAGASFAVTVIAGYLVSPVFSVLWDPWAAYMNAPWSI
tara:strand:+ start:662 stop:919 length:258 start_codon:yes stop_codon:yes gene_type:complete